MKALTLVCLLAALAAPAAVAQAPQAAPSGEVTDVDILNFALQLEYLEAEFYSCAATGEPLPDELRGGGPASTGCRKARLRPAGQAIADELAANERAHVTLLRTALGSEAVPIPRINIGPAFAAAANAAAGMELTPAFSPYRNDLFFLLGAFIFEDVGVTAYLGAAGLIQNPQYLTTAAQILAVEAYHGGIIRDQLFAQITTTTPYNLTVGDVADAISDLRGELGNAKDVPLTAQDGSDGANLVPADSQGLAYQRTPTEILNIVTAGSPSGGGFFPDGLNGALGSASS